jgi:hypothetical protein
VSVQGRHAAINCLPLVTTPLLVSALRVITITTRTLTIRPPIIFLPAFPQSLLCLWGPTLYLFIVDLDADLHLVLDLGVRCDPIIHDGLLRDGTFETGMSPLGAGFFF